MMAMLSDMFKVVVCVVVVCHNRVGYVFQVWIHYSQVSLKTS